MFKSLRPRQRVYPDVMGYFLFTLGRIIYKMRKSFLAQKIAALNEKEQFDIFCKVPIPPLGFYIIAGGGPDNMMEVHPSILR